MYKKKILYRNNAKPLACFENMGAQGNWHSNQISDVNYSLFETVQKEDKVKRLYCLQFKLLFKHNQQSVSVAASTPYTYSNLT